MRGPAHGVIAATGSTPDAPHGPPPEETPADADERPAPRAPAAGGLALVTVTIAAIAGLALRVLLLVNPIGRPDSDEVIAGLMARHLGSDPFPLFFWGQYYGGTLTLPLTALSMWVFGSNTAAMRLPSIAMTAGCAVLLWRVARRVTNERAAQTAAVLLWVGAPPAVWLSAREMLWYIPTLLLGLVAVLLAYRLRTGEGSRDRLALLLALVLVLGFWESPNIWYFGLPALVALGGPVAQARLTRLPAPRRAVVLTATVVVLVVGAAVVALAGPPLLHRISPNAGPALGLGQFPARFASFFTDGLPGVLGFREMFTYEWIGGPVGLVGYLCVLAVIIVGVGRALREWAWDGIGFLLYPFLFATVPKALDDPNLRYLLFVTPFVATAVARVVAPSPDRSPRRTARWAPHVAVAVALLLTVVGFQRLHVGSEIERTYRVGMAGDLDAVIDELDRDGITSAYANYWITYRLAFESDERIIAAHPYDPPRYEPYLERVRRDPRAAWVVEPGPTLDALRRGLRDLGVAAREVPAGDFVVVLPERHVDPDELRGSLLGAI